MELSPNTPRQRNRRADRAAAQEPQSIQPIPQTPVVQRVQTDYQQTGYAQTPPVSQSVPVPQTTPIPQAAPIPQTPRSMYQQPSAPVRPAGYSQPPYVQNGFLQQPQSPAPVQPTPQQPNTQPRALQQSRTMNSIWQQPTVQQAEAPHARAEGDLNRVQARAAKIPLQTAKEREARSEKKKLPGWLTTAVSLSILLVMALAAAYWLMQAYLTTQENARIAAYRAVLDNYHVTEGADGTLRVTWQDEIEQYAAEYNLQPAFVTAIIRTESSFRTNAESSVGARGLMQMMPDTAEWIAGKLDDSSYTFDRMWDAETNIRYGCWYLAYLSKLFRGDAELVSAAYHAGQTTITQWLSDPNRSSDGLTLDLDRLSDGPTKQYIGRVTQAYGIYQSLLYPDAAFGAADVVSAGSHDAAAAGR